MMTFDHMMDNAATCCQRKDLLDNESVRECIELNIYKPIRHQLLSSLEETSHALESLREARTAARELMEELIIMQQAFDNATGLECHANVVAVAVNMRCEDWIDE